MAKKISSLDVKEKERLEKARKRKQSSDTRLPENGGRPEFDPYSLMKRDVGKGDRVRGFSGWYNDPEVAKTLENIFGKKKAGKEKDSNKKT